MTAQRIARVGFLVVALTLAAGTAAAQNGYSFLDASRSAIDYRVAPATPRPGCADLLALSGGDLIIVSAQTTPASEAGPAFCRVLGVIQPEIQFEVALPAAW